MRSPVLEPSRYPWAFAALLFWRSIVMRPGTQRIEPVALWRDDRFAWYGGLGRATIQRGSYM